MDKELVAKLINEMDEEKLASVIKGLSGDEKKSLMELVEEEKTAEEKAEVEKIASDYYAAGHIMGRGFLDALTEKD